MQPLVTAVSLDKIPDEMFDLLLTKSPDNATFIEFLKQGSVSFLLNLCDLAQQDIKAHRDPQEMDLRKAIGNLYRIQGRWVQAKIICRYQECEQCHTISLFVFLEIMESWLHKIPSAVMMKQMFSRKLAFDFFADKESHQYLINGKIAMLNELLLKKGYNNAAQDIIQLSSNQDISNFF